MALKTGRPSKTAKEMAIESVREISDASNDTSQEKMRRFNVDIPESLHRQIKIQAVKDGLKLNELTIKLFNEYLSK